MPARKNPMLLSGTNRNITSKESNLQQFVQVDDYAAMRITVHLIQYKEGSKMLQQLNLAIENYEYKKSNCHGVPFYLNKDIHIPKSEEAMDINL